MSERRIVLGDVLDNTEVIWELIECDRGRRWAQVKGTSLHTYHEGDQCNHGKCEPDHRIHFRGETIDRKVAADWYLEVR